MIEPIMKLLLPIILILYIIFYVFLVKNYSEKKQHILFYIKKGKFCYGCKDQVEEEDISLFEEEEEDNKTYTLCKACKRDEQLLTLFEKNKIKRFFKTFEFRRIIYKYDKIPTVLLGISLFFLIIHIIAIIFYNNNYIFNYLYYFFSYILWTYNTIKLNLTYKKKALLY